MEEQNCQICNSINQFEEDSKWFYKNLDLLREKKLAGRFVAIKNEEVIASDRDINVVIKAVEDKGKNPACIVIEYVYPEGEVILL